MAKKKVAASMDLKAKRITVMVVNISKWHKTQDKLSLVDAGALHSNYIKGALEVVTAQKGTPDVFLGDRFLATWNSVKPIGTHRSNACGAAIKILALQESTGLAFTFGVSSSEARCGNMGCDGMKKYTFMGNCASLCHMLERLNKTYETHILMDGAVEEEAKNNFVCRKMDMITVPRLQERPIAVHEVVSGKTVSEDEWMYQLQQGEAGNPFHPFEVAVNLFHKGQFAEAKVSLEKCTIEDRQKVLLMARIQNHIDNVGNSEHQHASVPVENPCA
jgi:class 3 adenylate cyclase